MLEQREINFICHHKDEKEPVILTCAGKNVPDAWNALWPMLFAVDSNKKTLVSVRIKR